MKKIRGKSQIDKIMKIFIDSTSFTHLLIIFISLLSLDSQFKQFISFIRFYIFQLKRNNFYNA